VLADRLKERAERGDAIVLGAVAEGLLLSVASADDDGVVVGGDVLRSESSPADR